jgi:hypothetical protein
MEQVLDWVVTALRAMLAGMFAMAPGMIFWLVVVTIFIAIRTVGHSRPLQKLSHRGETA